MQDVKTEIKSWPPRWLTSVSDSELATSRGWEVSDFTGILYNMMNKWVIAQFKPHPDI